MHEIDLATTICLLAQLLSLCHAVMELSPEMLPCLDESEAE